MKKALCVVGPTAVGKTDLALHFAPLLKGYLVSVDSRHVYKGLDIVSGKDLPLHSKFVAQNIPHFSNNKTFSLGYYSTDATRIYLVDLVEISYSFNVYDFVSLAYPLIQSIVKNGKLPILVGGTGFYFKALLDGVGTLKIPTDDALRAELQGYSVEKLQATLEKEEEKKFQSMNVSDRANPRRLARAIEVARWKKTNKIPRIKVPPLLRWNLGEKYDCFIVGLYATKEVLKQRIHERVEKWIKMGALEEVEKLFNLYDQLSSQVKTSVGYRELFEYCAGKVDLAKAIDNMKLAEYQYAKRQMTWFKKAKRIKWFDVSKNGFEKAIESEVSKWFQAS